MNSNAYDALQSIVRASASLRVPSGTRVLYDNPGRMERVFANHRNPSFARSGDYVSTLRVVPGIACYTAVNWYTRDYVRWNAVLTIDFWDRIEHVFKRYRCQATDWQAFGDRTPQQVYEINWPIAYAIHAVPWNTVARLVSISYGR